MTAPIALPSQELVRSFLDYNPATGIFIWLKSPADSVRVGAVAGSIRATGYRTVSLFGGKFQAHRLAWLWMTGDDPAELNVDHINGERDDNRWSNLRLATAGQNSANSERQRNNLSGFKGVSQNNGKWKACIRANGKDYYLGVFDTKELASAAYVAKANELHGEYASDGRPSSDSNSLKISELTEALEKLKGPDRELDLAIHLALNPDGDIAKIVSNPTYRCGLDGEAGYAWGFGPLGSAILFEKYTDDGRCTYNGGYPLPAYTASIDAALTLIPTGYLWKCSYSRHVPHVAEIVDYENHNGSFIGECDSNRAIALCIAALRARAALEGMK